MAEYQVGIRMRADASELVGASRQGAQGQSELAEAFKRTKDQTKETAEEGAKFVARLKEQAESIGMTRLQLEQYRASTMQLTQEQRRQAESSIAQIEAHKKNEEQVKLVGRATAAAAGAVASYAVATAVFVKGVIDQNDELQKLTQSLAVSTEFMSAFRYQGSLAGVTNEQLNTSVRNLARNMEEAKNGVGDGGKLFKALGGDIEIAVKSGVEMERLIPMIADAFQRLPDGPTKTALAMQLFGRGAERMIPLLNSGAAGMREMTEEAREFGLVVGGQAAQQSERFNDNLTRLNAAFTAGKRALATEYLPTLVEFTEKLIAATKATGGLVSGILAIATAKTGNGGTDIDARIREIDATIARNEKEQTAPRPWYQVANLGGWAFDAENRKLAQERAYLLTQRPQAKATGTALADWMEPGGYGGDAEARVRAALAKPDKAPRSAGAGVDDFERIIAQIQKKNAAEEAELQLGRKLTEGERLKVQVYEQLGATKRKLTNEELVAIDTALELMLASERAADAREKQAKAEDQAVKAYNASVEAQWKLIHAAEDHNRKLAEHNEEIGLTTEQLVKLKIARVEEALAVAEQNLALTNMKDASETELAIANARVEAARKLVDLTREGAQRTVALEQAKQAADAWKQTSDSIQRALTDALMRGFDKGKTFAQNLRDSLVNMFKTLVLEPIIRPIAQSAAGAVTNMLMPGMARSLGGGFPSMPGFDLGGLFGGGGGALASGASVGAFGEAAGLVASTELAALGGSAAGAVGGAGLMSGISAALPWVGGALAVGSMLGLFDEGGGPKPSQAGVLRTSGGFHLSQNDVPGAGITAMPGFDLLNAQLNDPTQYDPEILAQRLGYIQGAPGESAEAMWQKLLQQIEPAHVAAIEKSKKNADDALKAERERTKAILDQVQGTLKLGDAARAFMQQIRDLNLSELSPLTAKERLDYARGQYSGLLDRARSGDAEALQGLGGSAQDYLREARDFYASSPTYSAIFGGVQGDAGALVSNLNANWSDQISASFREATEAQTREIVAALKDQGVSIERGVAGVLEALVRA